MGGKAVCNPHRHTCHADHILAGNMCVWDWQGGNLLARVAVQAELVGTAVTDDGGIVCAGTKDIKVGRRVGG